MNRDMSVPCEEGIINLRVGAIIMKDGKILMVGNDVRPEYLYSVGGRIKFGELAKEAIVREVYEETGVKMEVERLGFVHENYFTCDSGAHIGKLVYEISYFFYMKVPEGFDPGEGSFTEDGATEKLRWIDIDDPIKYYPEFFREELKHPSTGIKFFVTDDREK